MVVASKPLQLWFKMLGQFCATACHLGVVIFSVPPQATSMEKATRFMLNGQM